MALYSDPPPLSTFSEDKPTLLVCWWITSFCAVIITLRITGRFLRTEKLFREDKTAALALIPLFLRMGCVHLILIWGTNNAQLAGAGLSDEVLSKKAIASGLVLLSRLLYAATLWILKSAILEFFIRLNVTWKRSYDISLLFIRATLVATFIAVVISDLSECRPFPRHWQVLPDPGGQCRQGYAQLLTMAVCNIVTDLLLVFVPIPVILRSQMSTKRKIQLVLLFSLSLVVVAITIYRVPHIIRAHGRQQTRSLLASVELLFATAASNALVLGSFVRDRGVKKRKFKYDSVAATSLDRSSGGAGGAEPRRPLRHWGSDEDLVRDVGYGVRPHLRQPPAEKGGGGPARMHDDAMNSWSFPTTTTTHKQDNRLSAAAQSDDPLLNRVPSTRSNSTTAAAAPRKVSFLDPGNLLGDGADDDDDDTASRRRASAASSEKRRSSNVPPQSVPASGRGFRRGSSALLQDLGGLLSPIGGGGGKGQETPTSPKTKAAKHIKGPPPEYSAPAATGPWRPELELVDAGGLLK
ncbi:hypothetical protein QBC39DRAFT_137893 [Podospora conica]|nr:hypothetical protein QBC39DRAFT_137893 [Schizothecium conicum]